MGDEVRIGEGRLDEEQNRWVGERTVRRVWLAKVGDLMSRLGERDAHAAVERWLTGDGAKVPGRTALEGQAKRLAKIESDMRDAGETRDAAMVELARFCVEACQ